MLEAANGAEAIEEFQAENGIDLVLTDIVMPGMRGTELAEQIKETKPGVRILFMSAYTDDRTGTAALGVDAPFIPKPFTPASLIRKVRKVLDTPSSKRVKGGLRRRFGERSAVQDGVGEFRDQFQRVEDDVGRFYSTRGA